MTFEQTVKNILGEQAFMIAYLQQQLAERDTKITELEKAQNDSSRTEQ